MGFFSDIFNFKKQKQDIFCIMPWVHLHVTQYGTVTPCCQAPWQEEKAFGNINKESIHLIWNGDKIAEFRKNMLKNRPDERCKQCYIKEEQGFTSLRQITNKKYRHHYGLCKTGTTQPVYFDIRFNNSCNLRCRMCGPWSSSSWHKEAVLLGMRDESTKPLTYAFKNSASFFEELAPLLEQTEEFYFAGGEPLVMQEHYTILEELISRNKTEVMLTYNTNFSSFTYKNYNVLELWKRFKKVNISASLDAEGQRGELLRKNLIWDEVIKNRKLLLEFQNLEFTVSPTINSYNLLHLPDFHKSWVNQGLIKAEDFIPTLLINPAELNVVNLPQWYKLEAVNKYQEHIGWITTSDVKNLEKYEYMLQQFRNVIVVLQSENVASSTLDSFVDHIKKLDALRKEETFDIFSELKSLIK